MHAIAPAADQAEVKLRRLQRVFPRLAWVAIFPDRFVCPRTFAASPD
jgi:hypothetical protein